MKKDSFNLCGWHHTMPLDKPDKDGRREIIRRLCFGPLETDIYGIEDDKFYSEYHYIEGILEGEVEFRYITKEKFLKELDNEIKLSKEHNADELARALLAVRSKLIESDK